MKQRELLQQSLLDLQAQWKRHEALVQALLQDKPLQAECSGACRHYRQLLSLISETVRVLDETRRAFKSKLLEQLRLRLLETLSKETGPASAWEQSRPQQSQ